MSLDLEAIRRAFLAETEEDLATVEEALLRLEKATDAEDLAVVFRKFHTLKGNALAVAQTQLSSFAHRIEDLLEELRSGKQTVTPGVVTYLLQVVDCVRSWLPATLDGSDRLPPTAEALLQRIQGGRLREDAARAAGVAVESETAGTLRIDVGRLDHLLSVTSEIAVARSRLALLVEQAATPEITVAYRALERLLTALHHSVSRVRMVPVAPLLRRHERVVRDLALAHGKQAELVVRDEGVEVDNSVIEQLKAPLMHMVRNAVHHGLETPAARTQAGKNAKGRIELRARHEGGDIVVEIEDDGAGLDRARILERARALGVVAEKETPSDRDVDRLIFCQGLSTAADVSSTSGRGVGLDVVHRHVEALGGSVVVESRQGQGTRFALHMPLTLAVIEGLLGRVGEQRLVIPMTGVVRCVDLESESKEAVDGVLDVEGHAVPFARLRSTFGIPGAPPRREVAVVIQGGPGQVGLAVDSLDGRGQIVVKPPGRFFRGLPAVSGLTILGDGQVAPILNVSGLLQERARLDSDTKGATAPADGEGAGAP